MNLKLILESQKQYFQSQSTRDIGMLKKLNKVFMSDSEVEILMNKIQENIH